MEGTTVILRPSLFNPKAPLYNYTKCHNYLEFWRYAKFKVVDTHSYYGSEYLIVVMDNPQEIIDKLGGLLTEDLEEEHTIWIEDAIIDRR